MIISQIYKIGELYFDETDNINVMLGYQNPVNPRKRNETPQLLIFKIDARKLNDISYNYDIVEYDISKKEDYLLGLAGGAGTNFSLSLSLNWKRKEKETEEQNEKAADKFWKKLIGIKKSDNLNDFFKVRGKWINIVLEDIESKKSELYTLFEEFIIKKGLTEFNYPLISQIRRDDDYLFLGKIPEMREMYQLLFFPKLITSGEEKLNCRICGTNKNLTEAFKLGMYSTTHSSFVMGFFPKMSGLLGQNIMCDECYLKTLYGFNYLQEKLNFYAYSLKVSNKSDKIFHFIIPMMNDRSLFEKSIELINKAKKHSDEEHEKSLSRQINDLHSRIERIKRNINKSSKDKIKKLEQEKLKKETQLGKVEDSLDMDILFDTLSTFDGNISILDIYYRITNVKQNPKIIEIVSDILLSSEMIKTLSDVFNVTKKKFGKVGLSDLRRLVEDRFFLQYYSSLLGLISESKVLFNNRCVDSLRKYFLADFAGFVYYGLSKKLKYYHLLEIYDRFDFMFKKADLWREN